MSLILAGVTGLSIPRKSHRTVSAAIAPRYRSSWTHHERPRGGFLLHEKAAVTSSDFFKRQQVLGAPHCTSALEFMSTAKGRNHGYFPSNHRTDRTS